MAGSTQELLQEYYELRTVIQGYPEETKALESKLRRKKEALKNMEAARPEDLDAIEELEQEISDRDTLFLETIKELEIRENKIVEKLKLLGNVPLLCTLTIKNDSDEPYSANFNFILVGGAVNVVRD